MLPCDGLHPTYSVPFGCHNGAGLLHGGVIDGTGSHGPSRFGARCAKFPPNSPSPSRRATVACACSEGFNTVWAAAVAVQA